MPEGAAGRRPRWAKRLLGAALAAVAFVVGANLYLLGTSRSAIVSPTDPGPARPYAIVLGNRVFPGDIPSDELAARLRTALAVYRAGRAGKIIVSGRAIGGYDEPRAMAAWLRARGVPVGDVILDSGGYRTAASVADAAAMGVRSAVMVSQGYHLPRALYLARHAGIDAVGVAAPDTVGAWSSSVRLFLRETTARAEVVLEVALRGVR